MAHQVSAPQPASLSQAYAPVPTAQDAPPSNEKNKLTSTTVASVLSYNSKTIAQSWSASQVLLAGVIPLVALIAWLACARASPHMFDTFAGEKIGGRFTQAQAKAIDVATGAILAPLFMAALNHVWFESARVSAVNEQKQNAIPLRTLVAASGTSAGNYDFFLLRNLIQGKTWRLFLLAILTLLSAVSRSALSNIIAYEAFSDQTSLADSVTLRLQRDIAIEEDLGMLDYTQLNLYDFTNVQNAEVAKQMMALLTELSFENAASKLSNFTYVAINATQQSLDSLPRSIVELRNVPAYRLFVGCHPALPWAITVGQPNTLLNTQIMLNFNATSTSNNTIFQANYPGVPGDIQQGDGDEYSYAAFAFLQAQEVYLGRLNRFNLTKDTVQSSFGDIHYRAFNMSASGFKGTQWMMSVSGIRCLLYREHGLLNSTRIFDDKLTAGVWNTTTTNFPNVRDDRKKEIVNSKLAKFQWSGLNFHAPGGTIPGLGPALSSSGRAWREGDPVVADPFPDFAFNYLYASGETQRILYEVAATNINASHHRPEYFVNVTAFATQEHYRITYVPSILLLGLLCLIGASIVTAAMAAYTWKSISARAHRKVDVTRLLVDSVLGLEDHKEDMVKAAQSGNSDLDAWAARYKVRYTSVADEDGTVQIVMEKAGL